MEIVKEDFRLGTLDDELRVDELCSQLLREFHEDLLQQGVTPLEAGQMAHGADYFIRDFVVAVKQRNIFEEISGMVRQFAGNWYIVSTLDPDLQVLTGYLKGIRAFYQYLAKCSLISDTFLRAVEKECDDITYYGERITSFWDIKGDGYFAWERECSLKERG